MSSIVICEKPSQKAKIEKAVGETYGRVYAARGHLLRLAEPEEVNPSWAKWSTDLLYPENGEYPRVPSRDKDHQERLARIKHALAAVNLVYLATDSDREGQLIGEEILQYCRFRGRVARIIFNAEDPSTLQAAFNAPRENIEFQGLYFSAFARQQADQVFNLSITRAWTCINQSRGGYGVVGAGRVKTPTMAIVCARELEIRNFVPKQYFDFSGKFDTEYGSCVLNLTPNAEARIFDHETAKAIQAAVLGWTGPLTVATTRKTQSPPDLFTMASLQKESSRKFKWGAQKTLDVAQVLYDADLITYPRASGKWLPEIEIPNMPRLLEHMKSMLDGSTLPVLSGLQSPVIRKGKSGHFSDKDLKGGNHSHHAIIPNLNTASDWRAKLAHLNADELQLFNLIMNRTLQALMPDHVYNSTKIDASVSISSSQFPLTFKRTGTAIVSLGWREVGVQVGSSSKSIPREIGRLENSADNEDDDEEIVNLPPIPDKAIARLDQANILAKTTTPPKRLSEGDLVDDMINAWRFVQNPEKQERLKLTNGIGTEATRGQIIEGLKEQKYLTEKKGLLHATDEALRMFDFLRKVSPHILSPGLTAEWEEMFEEIVRRNRQYKQVVEAIAGTAGRIIEISLDKMKNAEPLRLGAAPVVDPKILQRAKDLSFRTGVPLPAGAETNAHLLIGFLRANDDREKNEFGGFVPSEKALQYAEKLAQWLSTSIPDKARRDASALNDWINLNKRAAEEAAPTIAPSPKQLDLIRKIAERNGIQIPLDVIADARAASAWIDKNMFKAPVKKRSNSSGSSRKGRTPSSMRRSFQKTFS